MTKDQIPAGDILAIVTADDGATVVAIHDRAGRSLDIVCSICGSPFTLLLSRGCTDDATNQHRAAFANDAGKHAATRHATHDATRGVS